MRVVAGLEHALAAELADGHALDERGVAGVLQDERARVRGRPVDGRRRPGRPGPPARPRRIAPPGPASWASDLTDTMVSSPRWRSRAAKPARSSAPSARVDVAILDLDARGRVRPRPSARPSWSASTQALARRRVGDAVLELDLGRAAVVERSARVVGGRSRARVQRARRRRPAGAGPWPRGPARGPAPSSRRTCRSCPRGPRGSPSGPTSRRAGAATSGGRRRA